MIKIILLIALISGNIFTSFGGWKIIQITSNSEGEYESIMYIQDGKIRQSAGAMDIIIDLKNSKMTYINHDKKTFWEGTKDDFKIEMEKYMIKTMGEDAYKEYKSNMEKMNDMNINDETLNIEINRDDEVMEVAGYKGTKFSVLTNGELVEEVWLCDKIKASKEFDISGFDQFVDQFFEQEDNHYSDSEEYINLMQNNGFPVKQVTYSYGEVEETTVLKEATEITLSNEIFEAPTGYSDSKLFEVMVFQDN